MQVTMIFRKMKIPESGRQEVISRFQESLFGN